MTKEIDNNRNDKKVINLLKKKGELEFSDFQNIFQLSMLGTRKKIIKYLNKGFIRVKDKEQVIYSYVAGDRVKFEE